MANKKKVSFRRRLKESLKALFGPPAEDPPAHEMLINVSEAHYALKTGDFQTWVEEAYKKNAVVNGALNLIMNTFNEADLNYVDEEGNILENHPTHQILQHMNDLDTQKVFFKRFLLYLYLGDVVYVQKVFTRRGKLTELGLLRPDRVQINASPSEGILGYEYVPNEELRTVQLSKDEIIFIQNIDPINRLHGYSPLKSLARRIDTDNELTDHVKAVIGNRGEPGSILMVPEEMDPDQALALAKSFDQRFTSLNKGKTCVLHGGMTYQTFGMNFKDLEADVLFKTQEAKILSTLGIPLAVYSSITGQEASTFDNMKTSYRMFWRNTIIPLQTMVEDYFNNDRDLVAEDEFNKGWRIKFDRSKVEALQEDQNALSDRARLDYQVGLITLNEARIAGGYDARDEGDDLRQMQAPQEPEMEEEESEPSEEEKAVTEPENKKDEEFEIEVDVDKDMLKSIIMECLEDLNGESLTEELHTNISNVNDVQNVTECPENKDIVEQNGQEETEKKIDAERLAMDYKIASARMLMADAAVVDVTRMMDKHFNRQIRDVLRSVRVAKDHRLVKQFQADRIKNEIRQYEEEWKVDLEADSKDTLGLLLVTVADDAAVAAGGSFTLTDSNTVDVVNRQTSQLADKSVRTSVKEINKVIDKAFEDGKTIAELTKDIQRLGDQFNAVRSKAIARTETVRAANKGAREGYRQAGVTRLRYSAVLDADTSEICEELDGKIVGIEESFLSQDEGFVLSNGTPMDLSYSGGVPEPPAHPNCRSTIIPEFE